MKIISPELFADLAFKLRKPLSAALCTTTLLFASLSAQASTGHSGAMVDTIADYMSWFVLIVMPIAGIAAFWMVHVMPEKIAHKRHHPQTKAIQVLCLLSLVFGGLLWPIAWLWAYTKPTSYRIAYGTDKHEDYHLDMAKKLNEGLLSEQERAHLRDELDAMFAKGALAPELSGLRAQLHGSQPGPAIAAAAKVGGAA